MKRQFNLPEEDVEYLEASEYSWETIISNGNWVVIHKYPVPEGYTIKEISLAFKIDAGYPNSQIDMVYFNPPLTRTDLKLIGALSVQQIDGKQWQRWSRHRTGANPWIVGVDCIATQLSLVDYWMEREFQLR